MIRYQIHPVNPQIRLLEIAVNILKNESGICIYPTDTVYGLGACATNPKAIDKIGTLMHKDTTRLFSFICSDFSQASNYVKISNPQYKLMKRYLPGPFTFILPATNYVPKKVCPKRKTVGIRIPANTVCTNLVKMLGEPIANTSLGIEGQYRGDPQYFEDTIAHEVDLFLETGVLDDPRGSTIIDLTEEEPVVIREGKGEWHG